MLLFTARVVGKRVIGLMMINISVIACVFIMFCLLIPSMQNLTFFFFAALLLIVIIAGIAYKGNLSSYQMENDLFIFPGELQICHIIFPMEEIEDLNFSFSSFNMSTKDNNSSNYGGLNNQISFRYKKQDFHYQFFLQSEQHFQQFIVMLEQLYRYQVRFEENNNHGKTFMMKNVNEAEYHHLKMKYQPF